MRLVHAATALAVVIVLALAVAGCGGGDSTAAGTGGETGVGTSGEGGDPGADVTFAGDGYPNTDPASTRLAEGEIDGSNAKSLKPAWQLPLTAESSYGAYSATPVVVGGVVYSQDLESDVQAISLASGEVLWTKRYGEPDQGPNGVAVGGASVFGATPTSAFALDRETGKEEWSVPLADGEGLAIDMAPGYGEGLVFVSTVPTNLRSEYPAGGVGTLWALDAKTGEKVWHFDTVPKSLWGKPKLNAGGGVWYPPSFDGAGGIYFGVGNPVPFPGAGKEPWGGSRPGPNLYTNSMVKLEAKTGKLDWYHQVTPHDLYDWDFQDSPVLVRAGGRELAIGAGKSGIVVALDAKSGKLVWQRPVGVHNGHDDDGILAMRGEGAKIEIGNVYPGTLGGVIAPMAANAKTLFVPVVNHPLKLVSGTELSEGPQASGELVVLDLASGEVVWVQKTPAPVYGSPTAVNDLVFISSFEGGVYAFDAERGIEVWGAELPAGSNTGLAISGDTLVVPAGLATAEGQKPALAAFRLGG